MNARFPIQKPAWCAILILSVLAFFPPFGGGTKDPLADPIATDYLRKRIRTDRKSSGCNPLALHPILQEKVDRAAISIIQGLQENPPNRSAPPELSQTALQSILPAAARLEWVCQIAKTRDELLSIPLPQTLSSDETITHLGAGVYRGQLANGMPFYLRVILWTPLWPELSEDLLRRGHRNFFFRCHLCGFQFKGRLAAGSVMDGSMEVLCPRCQRTFEILGPDIKGDYHVPTWFMRGFRPPGKLTDPLTAWLFLLANCRYVPDKIQFGREEVWQLAEDTHGRMQGDCEDFAILLADWLAAEGFAARVVMGHIRKGCGHAWVVLRLDGRDYILESTGGRKNYSRIPPRAEVLPDYFPVMQFDRSGIWFRKEKSWRGNYSSQRDWVRKP